MLNSTLRTSEAVTSTQAVALSDERKVYGRSDGSVVALDGGHGRPRAQQGDPTGRPRKEGVLAVMTINPVTLVERTSYINRPEGRIAYDVAARGLLWSPCPACGSGTSDWTDCSLDLKYPDHFQHTHISSPHRGGNRP